MTKLMIALAFAAAATACGAPAAATQWTGNYQCAGESWPVYTTTVTAYVRLEANHRIQLEGEPVCGVGNVLVGTLVDQ